MNIFHRKVVYWELFEEISLNCTIQNSTKYFHTGFTGWVKERVLPDPENNTIFKPNW